MKRKIGSPPDSGSKRQRPADDDQSTLKIYTDGSHFKHDVDQKIGGGAVFVHQGVIATKGWTFERQTVLEMFKLERGFPGSFSNPTAEMLAAANAIRIAIKMKESLVVTRVLLLADYIQVIEYANAKFKRPSFLPKYQKTFIYRKAVCCFLDALADAKKAGLSVTVRHIPGHSGDRYNDMADAIAKQGASAPDTVAEFFEK